MIKITLFGWAAFFHVHFMNQRHVLTPAEQIACDMCAMLQPFRMQLHVFGGVNE